MDFSFSRYRIVPLGSNSKIAQVGNERTLQFDLYNGRGFFRRSFNNAMTSFLECLGEIGSFAEGMDIPFADILDVTSFLPWVMHLLVTLIICH